MLAFYALTVVATGVLLIAVYRESQLGVWLTKPLAAAGFIGVGVVSGGMDSPYGRWVLVALVLSWCGDVLLIPKHSSRAFLFGLGAFLLGHVAYTVAFIVRGLAPVSGVITVVALCVPLVFLGRWLYPHVERGMRVPVILYMVVISLMVAGSVATVAAGGNARIPLGAVLFYLSDLAVARQRFVTQSFGNPAVGLPLYFAAQLILASTVA